MGNSEKSKQKILLIYDYFLKQVNPFDETTAVSMPEIINYLCDVTGQSFERKSVYSDIARINEFMVSTGNVDVGDEWIYLSTGRKYLRQELKYELSLDEARLIVDAISTTPFVETDLCLNIKQMYPSYFKNGYKSLIKHDSTINQRTKFLLNNIRTCIEERCVLCFRYGYKFAGGFRACSDKVTSPLALDWEDGNYYLIAVDNDAYATIGDREKSIRRYRIDRVDTRSQKVGKKTDYLGFRDEKDRILDKYLRSSVNAFASQDVRVITMKIDCVDEKTLMRAFNAFADGVNVKSIIEDKSSSGFVRFTFEAGIVPTLFTQLFRLSTFDGVRVDIEDKEVEAQFKEYLTRALG